MLFVFRVIIAVITLFANTAIYASTPQYAIIVDAGSSGSRLHLFQYETTDKLPIIEDLFSEEVKPGLSSFANPADAAASLNKLFDDAQVQLNAKHIDPNMVFIHVLATAGMRLLSADKANDIYQAIRVSLQAHYTFTIGDIATVSEKMEGVYGWLDVNYLANNFNNDTDTSVGIIDMGGASTEIAFSTHADPSNEVVIITINGVSYNVFSGNFLGLGQDQARAAMNTNTQAAACYPVNYAFSVNAIGSFNIATCSSLYADIIKQNMAERILPITNQHFVAYSGTYFDCHFLDADNNPTQKYIEQRIQTVCTQSWEQLKTNYSTTPEKYLANYCANSVHVTNLLFGTYQLQDGQLEVKNNINGKSIDWALGALLWKLV